MHLFGSRCESHQHHQEAYGIFFLIQSCKQEQARNHVLGCLCNVPGLLKMRMMPLSESLGYKTIAARHQIRTD